MKKTSQQYLNSEAHGYLMEAKACKLLLKDLERIRAKLRRHISILNRIFQDIDRDCRQCEFEALSPEEQLAELKRAEESRQAWRQYIASLKEMINPSAAQE